jgi:hypothetical protein
MALFRMLTRMAMRTSADAYTWSYVWYVEAADVEAAAVHGRDVVWPSLADAHKVYAFCYQIYASDLVPNTTNYTNLAVDPADQPGTIAASGQLYRASTTVRVELNIAGGRPSRKFHRVPLEEDDVTNGLTIATGIASDVSAAYAALLAASDIRDESGNTFSGYTVRGLSDRRLGKTSRNSVPPSP